MKPLPGPSWSTSPAGWSSSVAYDGWADVLKEPQEGIAIHHGGGGDYPAHQPPYSFTKEASQLRAWERYHLSKGWRGIAYNWAVGMSGQVYRLRGWNLNGAHLGDLDSDGISNQREILAVLFIMSGSLVAPSAEMLASFERLRAYIEEHQGKLYLYGHKEVQLAQPTSCPGKLNMAYITEHRVSGEQLVNTRRIAGINRYDTAAKVALESFPYPYGGRVYVATGVTFPDAVAASQTGHPLLFTAPDFLPPETRAAILALAPSEIVIVGGPTAVSPAVAQELDALIP